MSPVKHRDPAPSVLRYRLGRVWLTPSFQLMLRFGPIAAIGLGAVFYMATSESFHETTSKMVSDVRQAIVGRDEFRVTEMKIYGASDALKSEVALVAEMALPRVPSLMWRVDGRLRLLSADGVDLGQVASRLDRADLPLIAGAGASNRIEEAMELFSIAAPIAEQVRGLQRVGERRWNLVLDRDREIYLPETGATTALLRVMAIHATEDLLDKDISIVDLRDAKRPVLRLGAFAASELRPQKMSFTGDDQ